MKSKFPRNFVRMLPILMIWTCCERIEQEVGTEYSPVLGRWDLTVYDPAHVYPSWLELSAPEDELAGRFVGRFGSARPVLYAHFDGDELLFSLAPQYEPQVDDMIFIAALKNGRLDGETLSEKGERIRFSGVRAPELPRVDDIQWGEPLNQLPANDLSGWKVRHIDAPNGWILEDGVLTNTPPSVDLISRRTFDDFKLHIEFRMPENANSNSGIYLRGKYEVQVLDSFGQEPESHRCGGVYGFITPAAMPLKPAGEWNVYDIILIGRWITLIFNGETVIEDVEIPGITGGALNSRELDPGPIMLQGDHAGVSYRKIVITPAL